MSIMKLLECGVTLAITFASVTQSTALFYGDVSLNPADYAPEDIIIRDVCIIGGGSSGTYSAIRLKDMGKSVIVVEKKGRMGGHQYSWRDPVTNESIDTGVLIYHTNSDVVTSWFDRFNVPLLQIPNGAPTVTTVSMDFRTGELVRNVKPENYTARAIAMEAWKAQLARYPGLNQGIILPDPVPEDLYISFGSFASKYKVEALVPSFYHWAFFEGTAIEFTTLEMMKFLTPTMVNTIELGVTTTRRFNNSEVPALAQAELLAADSLLLNSTTIRSNRSNAGSVTLAVSTPGDIKLIQAKKLIISAPPILSNLAPFDLTEHEYSIFSQMTYLRFWGTLIRNTGLSDSINYTNAAANTPYNLPVYPGVFRFEPMGVPGIKQAGFGSYTDMSDDEVRAEIIATVHRLQKTFNISRTQPEIVSFLQGTPYNMMVNATAVKNGFYKDMYELQGTRNTFWTGAAWKSEDSSACWIHFEKMLPRIIKALS